MKKEDIEFLRELQHELNTQEHDGQASPRFWGIEETYLETAIDGDGDPYIVPYDPLDSYSQETLEEYVSRIEDEIKNLTEDTEDYQYILERWEILDKDDVDEVVDFVNDNLRTKRTKDVVVWMKECTSALFVGSSIHVLKTELIVNQPALRSARKPKTRRN